MQWLSGLILSLQIWAPVHLLAAPFAIQLPGHGLGKAPDDPSASACHAEEMWVKLQALALVTAAT